MSKIIPFRPFSYKPGSISVAEEENGKKANVRKKKSGKKMRVAFWLTAAQRDALVIASGKRINRRKRPHGRTWASLVRREFVDSYASSRHLPPSQRSYRLTSLGRKVVNMLDEMGVL